MAGALILAIRQLADPALQRLVWRCILLALGTLVTLIALVAGGLAALDATGIGWLDTTITFAGSGLAFLLAWLLFPPAIVASLNFFAEQVADVVEREHYPQLPPPSGLSLTEQGVGTLRFAAFALLLNLLALPFYLLPGPNILIYLALNGYLLGREYFEVVAQRRLALPVVAQLRRQVIVRLWLCGAIIALMLMVPLFNLLAPVVATAFMVHLFERWRRRHPLAAVEAGALPRTRAAVVRPAGDRSV